MKYRRGTSLVELLLVMSACTVVLTLSAELIHRVMIVQAKATAFSNAERSAQRLSIAFRRDVNQSTGRSDTDDSQESASLLQLTMPSDQLVEYRLDGGTIERVLHEGDAVKAREQFPFPKGIAASVREDIQGALVLSIKTPINPPTHGEVEVQSQAFIVPLNLEVEAVLNRNSRLMAPASSERSMP